MIEIIPAIGFVVFVVPFIIWIARIVRRQREVWREWCERPRKSDDVFLRECDLPDDDWSRTIALATRRALSEATGVPSTTINAHDPLRHEFWDSIDWLDIIFRIEKAAVVKIPRSPALDAVRERGREATVADLVRAIMTSALRHDRDNEVRKRKRPSPV